MSRYAGATGVLVLAIIVGAGAALRLRTIWVMPAQVVEGLYDFASLAFQNRALSTTADAYRQYAARYPHALGYPMLVLLPAFAAFGHGVRISLFANLVCDMGSVLPVYYISRKTAGRLAGLLSAALLSLGRHAF